MKTSEKYLITNIDGTDVALPTGQNIVSFKNIVKLTPSGAFICKCLSTSHTLPELREMVYREYECTESDKGTVNSLINEFVENAVSIGLILP